MACLRFYGVQEYERIADVCRCEILGLTALTDEALDGTVAPCHFAPTPWPARLHARSRLPNALCGRLNA